MASAVGFCRLSGAVCREASLGATLVVQVRTVARAGRGKIGFGLQAVP